MSTFVLKREYALQLPNSFVEIDREEMQYVDGGILLSKKWYGFSIWFNSRETDGLLIAIGLGSATAWLAAELSAAGIVTLPASVPFGVIGAALAVAAGTIGAVYWKNNGSGFSANFTNSGGMFGIW